MYSFYNIGNNINKIIYMEVMMKKIILFILIMFSSISIVKAEDYVVRIGDNYYSNISSSVESAKDGDVITFVKGAKLSNKLTIPKNKNIIFDLNNNTLEVANIEDNYAIVVGGTLSIKGNGKIVVPGLYGIGVQPSGTLNIYNGTFVQKTGDYLIGSWGTTNIYDGTFDANYSAVNGFSGNVIINGGSFTGNDWPLVVGNVTINNGIFNKDVSNYLETNRVILTIKIDSNNINDYVNLVVEKNSIIDRDILSNELTKLPDNFIPDDYDIEGYYTDKNLTSMYNFDKEIINNTTIYLKLISNKDIPPKTGDLNIYIFISMIIISTISLFIIFKKKLYRN